VVNKDDYMFCLATVSALSQSLCALSSCSELYFVVTALLMLCRTNKVID